MTAPRFNAPDPDGHHDDLSLDELGGLSLVVPDDPRELEDDRQRWLAEQNRPPAAPHRRQPSRRARLILTAGVLAATMIVAAIAGGIGAFVIPPPTPAPPAAPLAIVTAAPGQVGGLLPAADLAAGSSVVLARSLRPAVIALIPDQCGDCSSWLAEIRRQAVEFGLTITLVVNPDQADRALDIEHALGSVRLTTMLDPTQAFATAFGSGTRTLVLVREDGVVTQVLHDPAYDLRLEAALLPLDSSLTGNA